MAITRSALLGASCAAACCQADDSSAAFWYGAPHEQSLPDDGAVNVSIGSSSAGAKCVAASVAVTCAVNSGDLGNRINDDPFPAWADTFEVTTNGSEVCALRTDIAAGWHEP